MKKEITKWIKKNATIVKATVLISFFVGYGEFIRDLQQDIDEVRYSRKINEIEKEHGKEIEDLKIKIDQLRIENMNLRQVQFNLMEEYMKKNNNIIEMEVSHENK